MWPRLLAAVFILLMIGLYFLTEDVRSVHHLGSSANSFKAAYQLLERNQVNSERIFGSARLFPLPDTDTLLIMDANRGKLSDEHISDLHDWVQSGGRLVLEARTLYYNDEDTDYEDDDAELSDEPFDPERVNYAIDGYDESDLEENDALLYSFGVSAWYVPREAVWPAPDSYVSQPQWRIEEDSREQLACLSPTGEERDNCERQLCGDGEHAPVYSLGNIGEQLRQVAFAPEKKLMHIDQFDRDDEDNYDATTPYTDTELNLSLDNQYGAQLLHLYYGEGDVLVVTNLDVWRNDKLAWLDHAWLLHEISDGYAQAWWVHSVDMPPLMAWLWQQAWPLLLSLLLMLAIFLWMKMPRVGVLLPQWQQGARDFLHHLRASANFLWRHRQIDALLTPLREQVRRRLRHQQGNDSLDQLCAVAQTLGISDNAVHHAMSHSPADDQELTQMIDTLQQLRSRI